MKLPWKEHSHFLYKHRASVPHLHKASEKAFILECSPLQSVWKQAPLYILIFQENSFIRRERLIAGLSGAQGPVQGLSWIAHSASGRLEWGL